MNYKIVKKNIVTVFGANVLSLLVGIVNGFFVPAFLSVDNYSMLKTFTLYVSYVGVLHLGFLDGLYLKYGGKYLKSINKKEALYEHNFLLKFQLIVSLIFFLIGILARNLIVSLVAISIVPINFLTYFNFIYQATGEMKLYARIKVLNPILVLILNLVLIFLIKKDNYILFVFSSISAYYLTYLIFEHKFLKLVETKEKQKVDVLPIFKTGIFIMLGNLFTMLFYSMDRWFVKFLLTTEDFAYYSFAISMMSIINLLISSVAMSLYPAFSRGYTSKTVKEIKKYLIIISSFSSLGFFIFSFIVNLWLKKYIYSLSVISILFAGLPAIAVINALYINLYKANKQERKYFYTVIKMAIVSFIFNVLAVVLYKSNFAIAIATTVAFYVWFFYSSKDFEGLETNWKEIVYILLFVNGFLFSTLKLSLTFGFIFLSLWILMLIMIFFKKEFVRLLRLLTSRE